MKIEDHEHLNTNLWISKSVTRVILQTHITLKKEKIRNSPQLYHNYPINPIKENHYNPWTPLFEISVLKNLDEAYYAGISSHFKRSAKQIYGI